MRPVTAFVMVALSALLVLQPTFSGSGISESDWLGKWFMVHDGKWKGYLTLLHNPEFDNDMVCMNIIGKYYSLNHRKWYKVWGFSMTTEKGKNFCWAANLWLSGNPYKPYDPQKNFDKEALNKIVFYIDFGTHIQRFDGYLFTWDKSFMVGLTWWGGKPFGFYAKKVG